MTRSGSAVVALLLSAGACGAESVDVCEALKRAAKLDGRTIVITGEVRRMDEFAVLKGSSCQKRLLFEYPDELKPTPASSLSRDGLFKVFSLALNLLTFGEKPETELVVTFEGRFDSAVKEVDGRTVRVRDGFGAWKTFDNRLVVKRVLRLEFTTLVEPQLPK